MDGNRIFKKALIFCLGFLLILTSFGYDVQAAGNISIAAPGTVNVGDTVSITVKNDPSGNFSTTGILKISGSASGSLVIAINGTESQTIKVKAITEGRINANFSGETSSLSTDFKEVSVSASRTISVIKKNTNTGGENTTGGGSSSGSYNPTLPKGETAAEKAARLEREAKEKLEARKKIPLIKNVNIISQSERLKGESVGTIPSVSNTLKYEYQLPRNINEFKLDIESIGDDVKLTYDQMYKLDENHDKVEIKVTAVQDEITQEYQLTIRRHAESAIKFEDKGATFNLIEDAILDDKLKEFGVKKVSLEGDKPVSYYQFNGLNFVLTSDIDGNGTWVQVDDKGKFVQEVFLVMDEDDQLYFLIDVELDEEDNRTIYGNKYERQAFTLPKAITEFDASMTFKNTILAWNYDDKGIITHQYKMPKVMNRTADVEDDSKVDTDVVEDVVLDTAEASNEFETVFVGHDGKVSEAFVVFDAQSNSMEFALYIMIAVIVLLVILFIGYWRYSSKKINAFIRSRENRDNIY